MPLCIKTVSSHHLCSWKMCTLTMNKRWVNSLPTSHYVNSRNLMSYFHIIKIHLSFNVNIVSEWFIPHSIQSVSLFKYRYLSLFVSSWSVRYGCLLSSSIGNNCSKNVLAKVQLRFWKVWIYIWTVFQLHCRHLAKSFPYACHTVRWVDCSQLDACVTTCEKNHSYFCDYTNYSFLENVESLFFL